MAIGVILIIFGLLYEQNLTLKIALVVLFVNMIFPSIYKPISVLWFGLAKVLGLVIPRVILTVIYFVVVVPIGFIWKLICKDPLKLQKWKKSNDSVMKNREYTYKSDDINHPY